MRTQAQSLPDIERWQLLLLFAATGEASDKMLDPLRIMKGMFLLEMQGGLGQHTYNFKPYSYGPFSTGVYRDLDVVQGLEFIERRPSGRDWTYIRATGAGKEAARELIAKLPKEEVELISAIQNEVLSKGFADLLRSIYQQYPEYAVNSVLEQR